MSWTDHPSLRVVGVGAAHGSGTPERQRAASLYADPVAWLVVDAVHAALDAAGPVGPAPAAGVLSVSDWGTRHTMRLIGAAAVSGRVSPLRFAGASPGSIAGLACIVHRFTGPSLMLSMPPAEGREPAGLLAAAWLMAGACTHVIVNEHEVHDDGLHTVRTVLLAARGPS